MKRLFRCPRQWQLLVSLCSIVLLAAWPAARAAEIVVTSTGDSGPGTLRGALASAANRDFISFSVTGAIAVTSGELVVTNGLVIVGPGPDLLEINGNGSSSVFRVGPMKVPKHTPVWISGLSITGGGNDTVKGGGIASANAILTVSNCVVSGNMAFEGGGIYNGGSDKATLLEIANCTVSSNTAYDGCGIFNDGTDGNTALALVNCTVSGNSSVGSDGSGGAIYSFAEGNNVSVKIKCCTISGNSVTGGLGGGVYINPLQGHTTVEMVDSTIYGNTALYGGGIYNDVGSATMKISCCTISSNSVLSTGQAGNIYNGSSLIMGSTIVSQGAISNAGAFVSLGYNLCDGAAGGGTNTDPGGLFKAHGDQRNTDPMLGPLQDNGGPTTTQALLTNSPAIDQGKRNTIPALSQNTDQRGLPRPVDIPNMPNAKGGDGSDIGAYEVQ